MLALETRVIGARGKRGTSKQQRQPQHDGAGQHRAEFAKQERLGSVELPDHATSCFGSLARSRPHRGYEEKEGAASELSLLPGRTPRI